MGDELNGGAMSSRERFDRIERMLEKIDEKLDGKVDASRFDDLTRQVEEIIRHGSTHAQDLEGQMAEKGKRLGVLERDAIRLATITEERTASQDGRLRATRIWIAAISCIAIVVSSASAVITLLHAFG